ncbi:hypothetical protein PUN28_018458 [Cardiocondyla obscurior]|uniref:Uncharacterized protein n=1 Tax=Cardiocondyla obscurior TaxID=286306 RepID=A0AAW2EEV2_9HYME
MSIIYFDDVVKITVMINHALYIIENFYHDCGKIENYILRGKKIKFWCDNLVTINSKIKAQNQVNQNFNFQGINQKLESNQVTISELKSTRKLCKYSTSVVKAKDRHSELYRQIVEQHAAIAAHREAERLAYEATSVVNDVNDH